MATRFLRPPAFFLRLLPLVLLTGVAQALSRTEMQTTGETTIVLHCSAFHLEDQTTEGSDTYCPDSLSVTTEVGSDSATTSFCSSELAEDDRYVYSRGNYMLLSFVSNSDTHYSGFNCTYEFILYAV
ncbi:hypothetical protein Pmani_027965 [Petrolisthes manimaculis]|uniref:CUB domain-containing protein n=1 Tax=Petrolisthes manimaculis TaxID=1843537 RepID=A0AAE1P2G3_9EUCA|nr:hypothetical protein Pmani_027965 [Petrolisthes manimaculis]